MKERLLKRLSVDSAMFNSRLHGIDHWKRVEKNGLRLAGSCGADPIIVTCFAYLHDCMRRNEGNDPEHGKRGAEYAKALRGQIFDLSDEQFEILTLACTWHTAGRETKDVTIATCWDADRLDLGRVGIVPSAKYLLTDEAQCIANGLAPPMSSR